MIYEIEKDKKKKTTIQQKPVQYASVPGKQSW